MSSEIFYEVITKDNLLHMAQSISVAALKKRAVKTKDTRICTEDY